MAAGDDDDRELWRRVTAGVKPLKARDETLRPPAAAPEKAGKLADPAKPAPVKRAKPPQSPPRPESVRPSAPALVPGRTDGVDKRTADRFRRGRMAVEARLDLHGHTQESAFRALTGFIEGSVAAGRRCVLVITGKGSGKGPGGGVLRDAAPRWLAQPALRRHILSISEAQQKDGGAGALYVLLRRKR